jgi:transcriptional regulator with XRE-family HTH domain
MSSAQPRELARSAFWKTAGQLIQLLRERHGWSYQEFAERAEVTADLVVAYELARVRFPEFEACWRITTALGVDLPSFLREVEKRAGVTLIAGYAHSRRGHSHSPRRSKPRPPSMTPSAISSASPAGSRNRFTPASAAVGGERVRTSGRPCQRL